MKKEIEKLIKEYTKTINKLVKEIVNSSMEDHYGEGYVHALQNIVNDLTSLIKEKEPIDSTPELERVEIIELCASEIEDLLHKPNHEEVSIFKNHTIIIRQM
ncbi:MAG: hypothetical protein KAS32_12445 [Candidatus Peribacteraceae bacterium]|nr:hypothetical protein [Candidatus Peribacteraceae bacterium]